MCSNLEKARYLKMLIEEIKTEVSKRKARKVEHALPAKPSWPGKAIQPTLAAYRR